MLFQINRIREHWLWGSIISNGLLLTSEGWLGSKWDSVLWMRTAPSRQLFQAGSKFLHAFVQQESAQANIKERVWKTSHNSYPVYLEYSTLLYLSCCCEHGHSSSSTSPARLPLQGQWCLQFQKESQLQVVQPPHYGHLQKPVPCAAE